MQPAIIEKRFEILNPPDRIIIYLPDEENCRFRAITFGEEIIEDNKFPSTAWNSEVPVTTVEESVVCVRSLGWLVCFRPSILVQRCMWSAVGILP